MAVRGNLNPKELVNLTGFGKQEGIARVDGARFIAIQHQMGEKKGGGLVTPYLALQFDEVYVGGDLKPIDDAAPVTMDLILCWGRAAKKNEQGLVTEEAMPIFRFQPAMVKSADDQNPSEVGVSDVEGDEKMKLVEIGSEGNTFVSSDGAVPFANSAIGIFMTQLEKKGFKAEIIGRGYAPDFIGMVYEFRTTPTKTVCERLGITYSPSNRIDPKTKQPIVDMCREITNVLVRPYEKSSGKSAAKTSAAAKTNGAATAKEAAAVVESGELDPKLEAALKAFVEANKGKTYDTLGKFIGAIGPTLVKASAYKLVNDLTNGWKKDIDSLGALGMAYGFGVEDGKVVIGTE